ncbi:MAG: carboxypeptidase regulatory-like domain-containing protein [Myxococcota bacterium]
MSAVIALLIVLFQLFSNPPTHESSPAEPEAPESEARGPSSPSALPEAWPDAGAAFGSLAYPSLHLSPATVVASDGDAVLAGAVVSLGSGAPIGNAELTFGSEGETGSEGTTQTVRSRPDGTFEFRSAEVGRFLLALVTAEGFLPFAPEWGHSPVVFHASPGKQVEGVLVQLSPAVSYRGRVVDLEGAGVEGAEIRLFGVTGGARSLAPLPDRYRSDSAGEFVFHAPDETVLEARHGERWGRGRVDFSVQASRALTIVLEENARPVPNELLGRVIDSDGNPVPDAMVRAAFVADNPAAPGAELHPEAQALTGTDGTVTLGPLDPGRHLVRVNATGFGRHSQLVTVPGDGFEAVLSEELVLRGRVESAGVPVASASVLVQESLGELQRRLVASGSTFAADGSFEIRGLREGTYLVSAIGHGFARSDVVEVALRDRTPPVLLEVKPGGRIAGRVVDEETGAPIAEARVTTEGDLQTLEAMSIQTSVSTGDDGRFDLQGVDVGLQSVFVAAEGYHGRIRSGLLVQPPEELAIGDIGLTPTHGEEPRIELAGIGVVLAAEGDVLRIGQVVEGGGGMEAGLVSGDAILAIGGVRVGELGFGGSIQRIRGPEGSWVRLRIRRADDSETDVDVPRRRIRT